MKHNMWLSILLLGLILMVSACGKTKDDPSTGALSMPDYDNEIQGVIGRFDPDKVILFSDQGEILLGGDMNLGGLKNGDSVTVYCGEILETYPSSTTVVEIVLHSHGSAADIPAEKLEMLQAMGWVLCEE